MNFLRIPIAIGIVLLCAGLGVLVGARTTPAGSKSFTIRARQYAYDPPVIHVSYRDTVHLILKSMDVVHGFYLDGHDIDVEIHPVAPAMRVRDFSVPGGLRPVGEIVFVANTPGKFRYRCSHTCGPLHPFMQGEMIVDPNYPFLAALGAVIGVFCAGVFIFAVRVRP